ncbi:MAG: hypothetical protein GTN73_10170 [Candidatus Aminicenantes bacterium]|nr:hypothetical protein [Candidatus Aminicenantes bacterium]
MFNERKSSFMKNMAFLVCIAFIIMIFPQVTHAATRSSSERFPFPKKSAPLISEFFSFFSLNLSPLGCDLALFYSLSSCTPLLPDESKKDYWDIDYDKKTNPIKNNGNSTSTKPPKQKDDTDT